MKIIKVFLTFVIFLQLSLFSKGTIFDTYKNQFNIAKKLYQKKEYKKALKRFEKLLKMAPDDAKLNFYIGRCALELKLYDEAMAAFDRVLIINPNHTRSKLEIARIYYETGQYDLATTQLDLVLKENIPESVKQNIIKFKANIENARKRNFISGSVSFGFNYDDNANNAIGETEFIVPLFNVPVKGEPKVSDSSMHFSASILDIYYPKNYKNWSIQSKGLVYLNSNKNFHKNNSLLFSIGITPIYTNKKYKISLPFGIDKVWLDGVGYSHTLKFGSSFLYALDPTSNLSTGFNLNRVYNDQDKNQDSIGYSFSAGYKRSFGKDPFVLSLGTSYAKSYKIRKVRTDIDSYSYGYNVQLFKHIYKGLNASVSFSKRYINYEDVDVLFKTKRRDREKKYNLTLSYNITKKFLISGSVNYIDHISNQAPFVYDKKTYSINLTKSF